MKQPREIFNEVSRIQEALIIHNIPSENVCYKVSGMEHLQLMNYLNDLLGNNENIAIVDIDFVKVLGINIVIG